MVTRMTSAVLLACALFLPRGTVARDEKLQAPNTTSATLKVLEIAGQDAACQNLLDVQFTLANGDASTVELPITTYPRFDVKTFRTEEFLQFMDERREQHYRETFTEEERRELEKIAGRYDSMLIFGDAKVAEDNPGVAPLVKRWIQFNASIFATVVDEYLAGRVETPDARKRHALDALAARPDTKSLEDGRVFETTNNEFRRYYVRQQSPETCYAASLTTVWQYYGWAAKQTDFVEQRVPRCGLSGGRRVMASFNEIISTIYHLRTGSDYPLFNWTGDRKNARLLGKIEYTQTLGIGSLVESYSWAYIDRPSLEGILGRVSSGAAPGSLSWTSPAQVQLEQLQRQSNQKVVGADGKTPNLFQKFDWHQTSNPLVAGYVMPLGHTGQLVSAMLGGDAVLVGLKNLRDGHTMLVTGVEYEPRFVLQGDEMLLTPATHIRRIRVLDPGPEVQSERWEGDVERFFAQFRFGIVIHQDR